MLVPVLFLESVRLKTDRDGQRRPRYDNGTWFVGVEVRRSMAWLGLRRNTRYFSSNLSFDEYLTSVGEIHVAQIKEAQRDHKAGQSVMPSHIFLVFSSVMLMD